jgi:protoporphyrinogen oxidase
VTEDNILILGGGFAGLAAAYRLAKRGVRSTILEAQAELGGLAGCTRIDGVLIENLYHHIKPEDGHLIELINEMGLSGQLRWADTRMGFYIDSEFHPFSTPADLLRFSPLPLMDRFRFALGVLKAKRTEGKTLEGLNAEEWVVREWGRTVYERIMRPMLMNKFGIPPAQISAGFLQGRIKGLSSAKSNVKGG